jgi:hypothetical protein
VLEEEEQIEVKASFAKDTLFRDNNKDKELLGKDLA